MQELSCLSHTSPAETYSNELASELASYSIFRIGSEWYAIDVKILSEIRPIHEIHGLPHNTDPFLKGIINVHGSIVVCVSVGALLGKNELDKVDSNQRTSRMIVTGIGSDKIAFPVTETTGSVRLNDEQLGETPAPNRLSSNTILKGMYRHKDRDIGIIDSHRLLESIKEHLA